MPSPQLPQVPQQAARPPRRKKKPYRPGADPVPEGVREQLGMPNIERAQHTRFHEDQLAPGAPNGGVKRARIKRLFTDAEEREALLEFAIADLNARGIFEEAKKDEINVDQYSIDRNFLPGEFYAICWFTRVHASVEGGRPGAVNYEGVSGGRTTNKLPMSHDDFEDRAEYAFVLEHLPESFIWFLDWVTRSQYPEYFPHAQMPGKVRMAQSMFDAADQKYLRGGVDGFFKAVCQTIAHWRGERETLLNRRNLVREDYARQKKLR